jgi:hypothetical protein
MASASRSVDAAADRKLAAASRHCCPRNLADGACLAPGGAVFFRLYENTLIRQTEAELIAQAAALSAIYATEVTEAGIPAAKLGPEVAYEAYREGYESVAGGGGGRKVYLVYGRYTPIEPDLDLAVDPILPPRPGRCRPIPIRTMPPSAASWRRSWRRRRRSRWPASSCWIRAVWR